MPGSAFPSFLSRKSRIKKKCLISAPLRLSHRCSELSERLHGYTFLRRLGRGAFGQVFLAETICNGGDKHPRLVAVKVVRRSKLTKESTRALALAEATNLRRVSETSSAAAKMFFTQLEETFCDAHNLYIVTDYLCGGTLREEMIRRNRYRAGTVLAMPMDRLVLIMAQLVEAIAELRKLRIIHRDIKPDNILIDACGNVCLADFGLSRRFEVGPESVECEEKSENRRKMMCDSVLSLFKSPRAKSSEGGVVDFVDKRDGDAMPETCMTDMGCGTLAYAAPEMHRGELYSFPADIYSLGVVFHELLFDRLPPLPPRSDEATADDAMNVNAQKSQMEAGLHWFLTTSLDGGPEPIPATALDLLSSLLSLDPCMRITLPALRGHPFFRGLHWPTLAARAYALPPYHASPHARVQVHARPRLTMSLFYFKRREKAVMRRKAMDVGILLDPTAVPRDGSGPTDEDRLEEAYNMHFVSERCKMKSRPGDIRLHGAGRARRCWDALCGLGKVGGVRKRKWVDDVKFSREGLLGGRTINKPTLAIDQQPKDTINVDVAKKVEVEVNVEQGDNPCVRESLRPVLPFPISLNSPSFSSLSSNDSQSIIASDGHDAPDRDSPRISERPIHPALRTCASSHERPHSEPQTRRSHKLRRITMRIPDQRQNVCVRSSPSLGIGLGSDVDLLQVSGREKEEEDRTSIIAIFARSFSSFRFGFVGSSASASGLFSSGSESTQQRHISLESKRCLPSSCPERERVESCEPTSDSDTPSSIYRLPRTMEVFPPSPSPSSPSPPLSLLPSQTQTAQNITLPTLLFPPCPPLSISSSACTSTSASISSSLPATPGSEPVTPLGFGSLGTKGGYDLSVRCAGDIKESENENAQDEPWLESELSVPKRPFVLDAPPLRRRAGVSS